jgi:ATP/maltotriose-dependent transcriptional regulator MalT
MGATQETEQLELGRAAFERREWGAALSRLTAADSETALEPEDLERAATAAQLLGKFDASADLTARAYRDLLEGGNEERAARCAFWLGMNLIQRGEMAPGQAWIARAGRLVGDDEHDCVEQGYVLVPVALQSMVAGDAASALTIFEQVAEYGRRFNDLDLLTLSRLGRGRSLIQLGRIHEGVTHLDEAMVSVTADEVSPRITGLVYCSVIDSCQSTYDLRRAREWTAALSDWCSTQPDLVPFRGQCLVHRSQIMQFQGAWAEAMAEAHRAHEALSAMAGEAVGLAFYQFGELHRLRGEIVEAEESYLQANQWGHTPQPGMAQLRLAQGQIDAAKTAIHSALDDAHGSVARARLLPAFIEIMLAANEVESADAAADELSKLADDFGTSLLSVIRDQVQGAVLLARGEDRRALDTLQRACNSWRDLDVPYEAARTRVLVGLARRKLGDDESAALEFDAARRSFRELGAMPDLSGLDKLSGHAGSSRAGGLTGREVEVLALVATGKTNRQIATDLVISEKTVARHISNMFTKLQLSSRAAATAYAYEHDLV